MNAARPQMKSTGPDPILERVNIDGTVSSSFARIRMAQTYRNASDTNVEIVYTFPLPLQSTLLDVVTVLDGKRHRGTVLARVEAEEGYEGAIEKGDTAIMVERPEPSLFTMNLGNLLAGETATIEVEFAMLLDWRRNQLRLSLPMTLAPRYDEEHSPLQPHQKPFNDILVERPFSLALQLSKDFDGASIASPTHRLATQFREGGVEVRLQRSEAWMDKDFVLTVETESAPRPFACLAPDGDGKVFYGSVQIPPANAAAPARDVKIVLDCSGSMNGDSISLAREGVLKLLEKLRPEDRFGLVAFGSHAIQWEPEVLPASEHSLEAASAWVRERDADMGGTEMEGALNSAIAMPGAGKQCDVFLITDGQTGRTRELEKMARRAGHRMFVVGVGVAPQQDPLRELAETTGGAIEWVTPGEFMADAIHKIFARLIEIPVSDLRVVSDGGFEWEARTPAHSVFTGDTVHFFGAIRDARAPVHVEWRRPDGSTQSLPLRMGEELGAEVLAAIPRVAASLRIRDLQRHDESSEEAVQLAVQYQLVTAQTNHLLIVEREGKRATGIPAIRQVPQVMPPGWGVASDKRALRHGKGLPSYPANESSSVAGVYCMSLPDTEDVGVKHYRAKKSAPWSDVGVKHYRTKKSAPWSIEDFVESANKHYSSLIRVTPLAGAFHELLSLGLPIELLDELYELSRLSPEKDVVLAFWCALHKRAAALHLGRGLRRSMRRAGLPLSANQHLVLAIGSRLEQLSGALATAG